MEKKFANLGTMLSRDQAKKIVGGREDELGGGYKCCWTGTTNCSICVPAAYPSCVTGTTAVSC